MNLELNLEENSYLKFSKPPYENNKLYNMYNYLSAGPENRDLYSIEDFVENVDFEEFTKYTTMEHVIAFNRALETFHTHYSHWLPEYTFEITPSYLWKRGVYDALKEWHIKNCGFLKRNSGIEPFFNRIDSNAWMYNRLKEQLVTLDYKRKKARLAVGRVVDNLDDLISKFKNTIDEINDSTEKANKFSKLFQIYNHIAYPSNNTTLEESDYTGVQLFTVVIAEPKNMMVIRGENEKLFDIKVPRAYLIFQRPLFRALSGNSRSYSINSSAYSPGMKHPYIDCNREPFYDRDISNRISLHRMNQIPWGTLCLSSFTDDILGALRKNDYISFISSISFWNSIYNMDTTNPYNHPKTIFYQLGIAADNKDAENLQRLSLFKPVECFKQNMSMRRYVEEDDSIRVEINSHLEGNYYLYGNDIIKDCNAKNCAFKANCTAYNELTTIDDDYYYMIESILGATIESENTTRSTYSLLLSFSRLYTHILRIPVEERSITMFYKLESIKYWDEPVKLTGEEKMATWINVNSVASDTQRDRVETPQNS